MIQISIGSCLTSSGSTRSIIFSNISKSMKWKEKSRNAIEWLRQSSGSLQIHNLRNSIRPLENLRQRIVSHCLGIIPDICNFFIAVGRRMEGIYNIQLRHYLLSRQNSKCWTHYGCKKRRKGKLVYIELQGFWCKREKKASEDSKFQSLDEL